MQHSQGRAVGREDGIESEAVVIDCDSCVMRGPACRDCVVSVLIGVPDELLADERAALDVLAEAGLAPRLRLVPVRRSLSGPVSTPEFGVA